MLKSLPWNDIYNQFDPTRRLEQDDMDLFVARPGSVSDSIANHLEMNPRGKWVVGGSMGCGKSSELVRLYSLLKDRYAVIALDLNASSANVQRLTTGEVLFLIGAGTIKTANDVWGQKISQPNVVELKEAFQGVMRDDRDSPDMDHLLNSVALFGITLVQMAGHISDDAVSTMAGAIPVVAEARKLLKPLFPTFGGLAQSVTDGEPRLIRIQAAVDRILAEVRQTLREPLILADGLDKIMEQSSFEGLFASRSLCGSDAPTVFAVPIALMVSPMWKTIGDAFISERLTNVLVADVPDDLPWISVPAEKVEAGRKMLSAVASSRLKRLGLQIHAVFEPKALERLIIASGGVLRDYLRLIREAILQSHANNASIIDEDAAKEGISIIRKNLEITFNTKLLDELRHVRMHAEPSGNPESIELVLRGYILPYSNGRIWHELHPILRGIRPGL